MIPTPGWCASRGAAELFGCSIVPIPSLKVATDGRALSGFLVPDFRISSSNGAEASTTYYARIADNRDLAITGYAFTKVRPMAKLRYRALTDNGAYQITGYLTQSTATTVSGTNSAEQWRGYWMPTAISSFPPTGASIFRAASRPTAPSCGAITSIPTTRCVRPSMSSGSTIPASLSISGWAFQTLRTNEQQGLVPIALPMIDYRRRIENVGLGGTLELQANTLAISRSAGQDTQRAFTSARGACGASPAWGRSSRSPVWCAAMSTTRRATRSASVLYQAAGLAKPRHRAGRGGRDLAAGGRGAGRHAGVHPACAIGGIADLRNMAIPNEDGRAIELQESNLFALNRFPGYDRVEDGNRVVYGADWQLERPRWRVNATVGQSYRLSSQRDHCDGTGLSDRMSDIVGRTETVIAISSRSRTVSASITTVSRCAATNRPDQRRCHLSSRRAMRASNRHSVTTLKICPTATNCAPQAHHLRAYWSVFGSGVISICRTPRCSPTTMESARSSRCARLGHRSSRIVSSSISPGGGIISPSATRRGQQL
jgi:LPS-assembly protein